MGQKRDVTYGLGLGFMCPCKEPGGQVWGIKYAGLSSIHVFVLECAEVCINRLYIYIHARDSC